MGTRATIKFFWWWGISVGGIYATIKSDSQAFNYEIYAKYNKDLRRDEIYKVAIISNDKGYNFEGSVQEFNEFVLEKQYPEW